MDQGNRKRQKPWQPKAKLGRDEMNLAEFPLATLTSRVPNDVQTLSFTDRIWDPGERREVARRLTITGSDAYGLPTALDDEVILGLIQLTREADFSAAEVLFSRYRLIQLLGWREEGKSYARLETSLKRWVGVTLYYEKAWWDHREKAWMDESFHILERLTLFDRQRRLRRQGMNEPVLSSFVWNPVVFRSFQAGYVKKIDMDLFRRLRTPIAKRLYRILDKRFYHRDTWEFNLRDLACEHVGMSRTYDNAQLKRKLRRAVEELERQGFLEPAQWSGRFRRVSRGQWTITFTRSRPRMSRQGAVKRQRESGVSGAKMPVTSKTPGSRYRRPNDRDRPSEDKSRREMEDYWNALSVSRRRDFFAEAVEAAPDELRETLQRVSDAGEKLLVEVYEKIILEKHLAHVLKHPGPRNAA
jgi:hypothetical protein